jgi:hypothetical protein
VSRLPCCDDQPKLPKSELLFGKTFSDHMLEVDWDDQVP